MYVVERGGMQAYHAYRFPVYWQITAEKNSRYRRNLPRILRRVERIAIGVSIPV